MAIPAASRPAWIVAGLGLVLLCVIFGQEAAAAVQVWSASTAYGHCWLVLPIVAWLLWERRQVVATGLARPTAWPALAAVPLVLAWAVAAWLGIMEGRQLAMVGLTELLLIAAFGWRLWWALSPAFLYLVFLVPFGAFLTPALQRFTTAFILGGLRLLDVPFQADSFQITIPEGVFYVAEACAGLRFLIASVAFGVLYAVTIFRSPWRRAAFIGVACVVPVLANGVRGLGIVLLGHVLGSAEAGAADHLIYGWVFFSAVIVLLALAGLPFRQDSAVGRLPPVDAAPRASFGAVLLACAPLLLLAAAGPLALSWADAAPSAPLAAVTPRLVMPARCRADHATQAAGVSTQTVHCGAATLRVTAIALPPHANPSRILAAGRGVAEAGLSGEIDSTPWRTPGGAPWMLLSAHEPGRLAAYAVWVAGRQRLGSLADRLAMARGVFGAGPAAVAVAVTLQTPDADEAGQLQGFLTAQAGLSPAG